MANIKESSLNLGGLEHVFEYFHLHNNWEFNYLLLRSALDHSFCTQLLPQIWFSHPASTHRACAVSYVAEYKEARQTWREARRRYWFQEAGGTFELGNLEPWTSYNIRSAHSLDKSRFLVCNRQYLTEIVCQLLFHIIYDKFTATELGIGHASSYGPKAFKHVTR